MLLGLLTAIPLFAPLLHFLDDLLWTSRPAGRSERETFILHIQHVITLLENALITSSNVDSDARWLMNLKTRLTNIIEDLAPGNRSIVRSVRARWMYDERFIHETKREIDTALRLIELKTMVSLSGNVISLHGGMKRLMSMVNHPAFPAAPDLQSNTEVPPPQDWICPCNTSHNISHRGSIAEKEPSLAMMSRWESSAEEHPSFDDQVLNSAYQNVVLHRRLAQQDSASTGGASK
ncbi:unnamed protein product [Rhizoctonia solani]|uniref:Uncharacterized protein n=1 Tax=Rhizoctonia solani TaxID=456999 RepID=A0A8H3HME0_9AGAM|nr:unnamed protein product [Rhizoctonia solani]